MSLNPNILSPNGTYRVSFNNKFALELSAARQNPNILVLQETQIINKNFPGYPVFHHNDNYDYPKARLTILVKSNVNVTQHIKSTNNLLFQTIIINANAYLYITNICRESQDIFYHILRYLTTSN